MRKLVRLAQVGRQRHHTDIFVAAWQGDEPLIDAFLQVDRSLARLVDKSDFGVRCACARGGRGCTRRCTMLRTTATSPASSACWPRARTWTLPTRCVCSRVARPQEGATSLFLAAQQGHLACVERLLAAGARVDLWDSKVCWVVRATRQYGFSAADVAATGAV
jgi:hypothetical protein